MRQFNADVREFREEHWEFRNTCDAEERRVFADPVGNAPLLVERFADQAAHYRDLILENFGVDVLDPHPPSEGVTLTSKDLGNLFLWSALFGSKWDSLVRISQYLGEEEDEEAAARFVCKVWIDSLRAAPLLSISLGELMRNALSSHRDATRVFGEVIAAGLTGYVAAGTSLQRNKRLRDALAREGQELLEVLPAEALAAWDERSPGEDLDTLRSRALNRLEKALSRESEPKRVARADDDLEDAEDDLEEFERLETLRQQSHQLDSLKQIAKLSPREKQVYQRLRKGMKPEEIAEDLHIARNNVDQVKRNALAKLTAARKAAGLQKIPRKSAETF